MFISSKLVHKFMAGNSNPRDVAYPQTLIKNAAYLYYPNIEFSLIFTDYFVFKTLGGMVKESMSKQWRGYVYDNLKEDKKVAYKKGFAGALKVQLKEIGFNDEESLEF